MTEESRSIDLSVEVTGTPEQVWAAIATGPGISSWYVPSEVEERAGGSMTQRFGPGPEMQIAGRVEAWEPPHRVLFAGADGDAGLSFEWLVEARDGATCVVRLVNAGFGSGEDWDGQYDGMAEGWRLFLHNLQLHLAHFPGEHGTAMLPMAMWAGDRDAAWSRLLADLGLPPAPAAGSRVVAGPGAPPLAGTVVDCEPARRLSLLLDSPARGTAFLATEGSGDQTGVSVWLYLYGAGAAGVIARDEPEWSSWLAARAPAPA